MYQCPKANCDGGEFRVEVITYGVELLDASGEEFATSNGTPERTGHVYCNHCDARAEWVDARQAELFPVQSALC